MQYGDLDPVDKAVFDDFMNNFRAGEGELARLLNRLSILRDAWDAGAGTIHASLDAGAVVPNQSGLTGADNVTKEQILTAAVDLGGLLTTYNTPAKRQEYIDFAGATNIAGD